MKIILYILLFCSLSAQSQLIKQFSFERMPIQYREMGMEYGILSNITITDELKRDSAKSARLTLRASDPISQWGNKRTEFTVINNTSTPDTRVRWYKFSTYQPSKDWAPDTNPKIWPFQWHDRSDGRCSASPSLAMEVVNNRFQVQVRWSTKDYCDYRETRTGKSFDLGPVPFDRWNDWVIYYDPRADANGRIKIWLNEILIFDYTGPCHFIGSTFPYFKMGLYAWHWMNPVPAGLPTYHIGYVDALSIGGINEDWTPIKNEMEIEDIRTAYLYVSGKNITSYAWSTGQTSNIIAVQGERGTSQVITCTVTYKNGNKETRSYTVTY